MIFNTVAGWEVSGGKLFMEKIVLVSREPGKYEHMIALIEALFPECTVEIVSEAGGEFSQIPTHFEEETAP